MRDDQYRAFMIRGEKTVKEYGFTSLPVDVFRLACDLGISVVEAMPPSPDVPLPLGASVNENNEFIIIYNTSFDNVGLERFTIAHELGHYFLHGDSEEVKHHESRAGFVSNDKREREADCFAAGLLMPRILL